jgi:HSP20 family protein
MKNLGDKRLTALTVLVAVLLVAVAAQSVVLTKLYKRLDSGSEQPQVERVVDQSHREDDSTQSGMFAPDFFEPDPFQWDAQSWDPFREMHSMQDRINQMFGSAFNRFQDSDDFGSIFHEYSFSPDVNIQDGGDHYLVTMDLPGVEDSRLNVTIEGQTLTISGTIQTESTGKDRGQMLRQERRSGQFRRTVTLPSPVETGKMTSKHEKDGLYIRIPKVPIEQEAKGGETP